MEQELWARLEAVRERVAAAATRVGRSPHEVRLVAVTKTVSPERVAALAQLGVSCFGENRVEEAEDKLPAVRALVGTEAYEAQCWCLVGHLQSRKAARAVRLFDEIHSLDSARLATRLDRLAQGGARPLPVLLEVNVSGEASKYGLAASAWPGDTEQTAGLYREIEAIMRLRNLAVRGLMTVAPLVEDAEAVRPVFRRLRELRDALARRWPEHSWRELSMGMSDDYEVAIEEGATMIRLGRALFGPRS
jgi:pyridoxal phosphate enzyme (YggS family)